MATIPIEIILQDAETPVDPTPTPEETNIVVPDTGAGTVGSGSTFSSSSAASIILPAILLVVALATVCTLLLHKHRKCQDNDKFSKKEKLLTATSATIAVLSATVLVGNLVIPATSAATSVEPGTADLETVDKITITATREADSDTITATVKNTSYATANLDFGYKVTASMAAGLANANLYLDGDSDSEYYISPVTDGTLADNTWGYTLEEPSEESSYLSIPLSTKPTTMVKEIAKTAEDTPVDIYYTVQIDKDMPNGTYTGELEYTIAPAIEHMQDFSILTPAEKTATLAYMPEGKQYILKDIRDKKPYYISKLADNNVWMTQNLDLDIDENTTYTHADTDLGWSDPNSLDATAKWKPDKGHSTISFIGGTVEGWVDSRTAPYSADPSDVYYYTSGNNDPDTFFGSPEACERAHPDSSCPHYHAGNYYNWSAAAASNDTSGMITKYDNAPNSICPAGWRLPIGRNSDSEATGDFYILLDTQGDIFGERTPWGSGFWFTDGGLNTIRNNPLWFVRSGFILDFLQNDSVESKYWSSTVDGSSAYQLIFGDTSVGPANPNLSKEIGISIRCMMQ